MQVINQQKENVITILFYILGFNIYQMNFHDTTHYTGIVADLGKGPRGRTQ